MDSSKEQSLLYRFVLRRDFSWYACAHSSNDSLVYSSATISSDEMPIKVTLSAVLPTGARKELSLRLDELVALCKKRCEESALAIEQKASRTDTITFTVLSETRPSVTERIVRFANSLYSLGCSVDIVTTDISILPLGVLCPVRGVNNVFELYTSISSDVLIVSSVGELPAALLGTAHSTVRVFQLVHEIDDFGSCSDPSQIAKFKPLINTLNALPVEKIAITSEIQEFYQSVYGQPTLLVKDYVALPEETTAAVTQVYAAFDEEYAPIRLTQLVVNNGAVNGILELLEGLTIAAELIKPKKQFHVLLLLEKGVHNVFQGKVTISGVHVEVQRNCAEPEVQKALSHTDIWIDSSYNSTVGYHLLKAMSSSVSVLSVDNPSLSATKKSVECMSIAPRGNPGELASALIELISNHTRRRDQIIKGRILARQFSFEGHVNDLQSLCHTLHVMLSTPRDGNTTPCRASIVDVIEHPHFSILVPVYNHVQYLGAALDTLRAQTYPYWEAIVVNDGSTDETPSVMSAYAQSDARFKLFHKVNGGTASALNAALEQSSNPWICWLSSDDFFKPEKLSIHAQFISALPHVKFFHTLYSVYEEKIRKEVNDIADSHLHATRATAQTISFCRWNYVHGNTIAVHRSIFDRVGNFSLNYPNAQDFDLWFRMSFVTPFELIERVTCTTRIHDAAGTSQFPQAGFFDSYRSIVDTLNGINFQQLFPFVDFSNPSEVALAVQEAIFVAVTPSAFIYQGVIRDNSIILDKLHEWLDSDPQNAQYKHAILEKIHPMIERAQTNGVDASFLKLIAPLLDEQMPRFTYEPRDSIHDYVRSYEYGYAQRRADVCGIMGRYLNKLRKHKVKGALSYEMNVDLYQEK